MATLGAPKLVSPTIRFFRWSLLLSGVAYGHFRYNYLARKEKKIQEVDDVIRARIAERTAKEKLIASEAELGALGKECGVTSPAK